MELEMQIMSRETIKPSPPTQPHPKTHPLTRLDQLVSLLEYRTPLVLFYANNSKVDTNRLVDQLIASLSKTLSLFYPLTGRLTTDGLEIDCNDEGVPLIVTRVKSSLFTFLRMSNRVELVSRFVPNHVFDDSDTTYTGWFPLAIQLSIFECGGMAIGSHVLHKASIDGTSRAHFLKTWAAITVGSTTNVVAPDLTSAFSLFPPCNGLDSLTTEKPIILRPLAEPAHNYQACIVKAFAFSPHAIKALQYKAKSKNVPYPTRVEAVSAFLWKHLMAAATTANISKSNISEKVSNNVERKTTSQSILCHSVNMRPHIHPPLPPHTFGKFTTHAFVHCDLPNQLDLPELVVMLRKSFSKTKDINFISKFQGVRGEEATRQHGNKFKNLKEDIEGNSYIFASWGGLDDVDFGLGKPIWIGFTGGKVSRRFRNFVPLIHSPNFGIEAWMILDEQEMANLESNHEFLAFASPCSGLISSPKSSL